MINKVLSTALILFATLMFTSCDKNNPEPPVDPEVITTLNYTLSPSSGGSDVSLSFSDLDGDGGNAPIITGGKLEANTTYTGILELLNESVTPTEDITEEIAEEDEEHQFFFSNQHFKFKLCIQ